MSARWKRNAVVAVMAVLVCSAVALNWMYTGQEQSAGGKLLGEAQLVSGQGTEDAQSGGEQKSEGEQAPGSAESAGAPPDEGMIYTGSDYFACPTPSMADRDLFPGSGGLDRGGAWNSGGEAGLA